MISPIPAISAEAAAARIAHPQLGLGCILVLGQAAVVVDVVVAAADGQDAFFDESSSEARVEAGGCGGLGVGACAVGDEV